MKKKPNPIQIVRTDQMLKWAHYGSSALPSSRPPFPHLSLATVLILREQLPGLQIRTEPNQEQK